MNHEAESSHPSPPSAQSNRLLTNLLDDCSQDSSSRNAHLKGSAENNENRMEHESGYDEKGSHQFNLLDDKQQLYIALPEQLIQQQSQDVSQIFKFIEKNTKVPRLPVFPHRTLKCQAQYASQTRQDKLRRYLQKRSRRNWDKTIVYKCRKEVADKRQRVNGRFVRKQCVGGVWVSPIHKNSVSTGQVQFIKSLQASRNDFQQLLL